MRILLCQLLGISVYVITSILKENSWQSKADSKISEDSAMKNNRFNIRKDKQKVTIIKKRIKVRKNVKDDPWSWTVLIDGLPFVSGLGKEDIPYYKKLAFERLEIAAIRDLNEELGDKLGDVL